MVVDSPPVSPESRQVSLSLSAVQGEGDEGTGAVENETAVENCQEIGLVEIMFFFELLFFYVSSQFPSVFPLLTYSQSFFCLFC